MPSLVEEVLLTQCKQTDFDEAVAICVSKAGAHPCQIKNSQLPGGWLKILEVPDELKGFVVTILDGETIPEELVQSVTEEFWRQVKALPEYFTTLEMGSEIRLFSNWQVAAIYDNGDQD